MGCAIALALGAAPAHAEGGRITFVGAIVAPTCHVAGLPDVAPGSSHGGCGAAPGHASAPVAQYRQEVVPLEHAAGTQDRLLVYFAGYASMAKAQVVTRTYE